MRLLVTGDRYYEDGAKIRRCLEILRPSVVIHGKARGADVRAGFAAKALGIPVEEYPAHWDRYGYAAGPLRNKQMLDEGKPDYVLYFHDNLERSKGTKDMLERAHDAGLVILAPEDVLPPSDVAGIV